MTAAGWFDDDSLVHGPQLDFLRHLREAAARWRFADLVAGDTRAWPWPEDTSRLLVEVDVAGLTCRPRVLRVLYTPDSSDEPLLDSEWADEYLFDGPTGGADFCVSGVKATPSQCAEWTASWFEGALSRPIARREWDRPASGAARLLPPHSRSLAAVEWRFADTEELLDTTSALVWSWLTKMPPSRQIQERPGLS